jgi:hypothetical protein
VADPYNNTAEWDDTTRIVTYYENGVQTEQRPYTDEENAAADWREADAAAQAQAQEDALYREAFYQATVETQAPPTSGEDWVQPIDVHTSYALDSTVKHGGKTWVSLTPFNVWEPGVSGWREVVSTGYPAWVQPTGGHDAYPRGAKVSHKGQNWENTGSDANVWEPGVYGWTEVP